VTCSPAHHLKSVMHTASRATVTFPAPTYWPRKVMGGLALHWPWCFTDFSDVQYLWCRKRGEQPARSMAPFIFLIDAWRREEFNADGKYDGEDNDEDGLTVAAVKQQIKNVIHQSHYHSTSSGRTSRDKGTIDFFSASIDSAFLMSARSQFTISPPQSTRHLPVSRINYKFTYLLTHIQHTTVVGFPSVL